VQPLKVLWLSVCLCEHNVVDMRASKGYMRWIKSATISNVVYKEIFRNLPTWGVCLL